MSHSEPQAPVQITPVELMTFLAKLAESQPELTHFVEKHAPTHPVIMNELVGVLIRSSAFSSMKQGESPTLSEAPSRSSSLASPPAEPLAISSEPVRRHDDRGVLLPEFRTPDRPMVRDWPGRNLPQGSTWAL